VEAGQRGHARVDPSDESRCGDPRHRGVLTSPELARQAARRSVKVVTTPDCIDGSSPTCAASAPAFPRPGYPLLPASMGKKVIVVGAGLHGIEVAEYLAKTRSHSHHRRAHRVIGEGVHRFPAWTHHGLVRHEGVRIINGSEEPRGDRQGAGLRRRERSARRARGRHRMPTSPLTSNDKLYKALEGKVPELYLIGDGKEAGMIVHAVRSGYQTAKGL